MRLSWNEIRARAASGCSGAPARRTRRVWLRWPRLGAAAGGEEAMKLSELSGVPPSFQFEEFLVGF